MGDINKLLQIMEKLRHPEDGCPWDREQTFTTIAPYTIEESYEVADAIHRNDIQELKYELGDLLFQVVFHSQMASELDHFTFNDVVAAVCEKMERRHPHVFSDAKVESAEAQTKAWEEIKAQERKQKGKDELKNKGSHQTESILDGISMRMPALTRAVKLQKRAANVGFDWPDHVGVIEKVKEELDEVIQEIENNHFENLNREIGDLLFVIANLARRFNVDPESAVTSTNAKFEKRFRVIEQELNRLNKDFAQTDLKEMDDLWNKAKEEHF
ncbi:MAG: nucleoside triphosphate pyrophosphohydrolase [Gammaproteobacteria bacterium]|nr:MAG: nucleoside triphosphate pyrophosphohydrolase [Gammaproteobacteria bacterium]